MSFYAALFAAIIGKAQECAADARVALVNGTPVTVETAADYGQVSAIMVGIGWEPDTDGYTSWWTNGGAEFYSRVPANAPAPTY